MADILYCLFVKPIELVVEAIFILMYRLFAVEGVAIVFVSIVVQLLVLPMYKRSDAMQEIEREKQKKMKPWVDHIKKTFKGDERFMILQTYYRSERYNPLSAIKGSLSLLLQIPFFIAAYNYLSNLSLLEGASFLGIKDLSMPDGILSVCGVPVNILPILMTIFNIISGIIYTKGFPIKDKIQTYGLAAVFLVVLYNSPSGLVLYWTLNNLFSLLKNIFMKLINNSRTVLGIVSALLGLFVLAYYSITVGVFSKKRILLLGLMLIASFIPIILNVIRKRRTKKSNDTIKTDMASTTDSNYGVIFTLSSVILTLLLGAIIPISVVGASPVEFVSVNYGPLGLVIRTLAVYAGILLIWVRIFYMLASEKGKRVMTLCVSAITFIALVNYYFFGRQLGTMSAFLQYDDSPVFGTGAKLLSVVIVAVVFVLAYIVLAKKDVALKRLCQIGVLALSILTIVGGFGIYKEVPSINEADSNGYEKILPLSKSGKNVVVLMLDRAIATYVPYLINEKPELAKMYDGFTYYPNTLSYATITNMASGPLFGGYDYMPANVDKRRNESLESKQNEALKVLPKLFLDNDYKVVVTDPPLAGYSFVPNLSIYDDIKNTNKGLESYVLCGKYSQASKKIFSSYFEGKQKRSFVYYSLMKSCPVILQSSIYDGGNYNSTEPDISVNQAFLNNYSVLESLSSITDIKNDSSNNFLMMQNETTHSPTILQKPDYVPAARISGSVKGDESRFTLNGVTCVVENDLQISHYDVNMAALLSVGRWLDYLKEQGVYDNTRIVIVADHGRDMYHFDSMVIDDGVHRREDIESYNPLLLYKDFNSKGFTVSNDFMTNADTPTLAVHDLINNPVNPYTGNPLNSDRKTSEPQYVNTSGNWDITNNNGNTFKTKEGLWYLVKDNMLNPKNWTYIGEELKP